MEPQESPQSNPPVMQPSQPVSSPIPSQLPPRRPVLPLVIIIFCVGIAGFFAFQYFQLKQQISQQDQTVISPTPIANQIGSGLTSPTVQPTENPNNYPPDNAPPDWKTFSNQKYSYSVKYPADYSVSSDLYDSNPKDSSSVIIKKTSDDYGKPTMYIQVNDVSVSGEYSYKNQPFKTIDELATIHHTDILQSTDTFLSEIKGMLKTTFQGLPAYTYTEQVKGFTGITTSNQGTTGPITYIVFQYKSSFYLIGFYEEPTLEQIVSTFQMKQE